MIGEKLFYIISQNCLRVNQTNYYSEHIFICIPPLEKGGKEGFEGFGNPPVPPEGVKKLEDCGSAHRVGRLVQALEGGLLDVMGNLRFR
ncbi:MAG: hypothetical protein Q8P64_13080 [Deltaproteobacteria bacterium]|nr:hypothetical protein [Deltaproteobacteria bacterium]